MGHSLPSGDLSSAAMDWAEPCPLFPKRGEEQPLPMNPLWAKDRQGEAGAAEYSSVILGKSTSQLGEGRFYPLMSGQTASPLEA